MIKESEEQEKLPSTQNKYSSTTIKVKKSKKKQGGQSIKKSLKVHMRRKHTNLTDNDYPAECEFCDLELKSESDMKMHLKIGHIYSETKFK